MSKDRGFKETSVKPLLHMHMTRVTLLLPRKLRGLLPGCCPEDEEENLPDNDGNDPKEKEKEEPDPGRKLHILKNLDSTFPDPPHAPIKEGKHHHRPVVVTRTREGDQMLCPHCGRNIAPEAIYTDSKGWTFHRPCMSKGSIKLPEKEASFQPKRFLFEYDQTPDPARYQLSKQAVGESRLYVTPRSFGATTVGQSLNKRMLIPYLNSPEAAATGNGPEALAESPYAQPEFLLPALGAGGGALLGSRSRSTKGRLLGALQGLAAGAGAAGGQALAGHFTEGDVGARLGGGAAGGALAYLLASQLGKLTEAD